MARNVQCRRCQAWGHNATDRECPLFGVLKTAEGEEAERHDFEDPAVLSVSILLHLKLALLSVCPYPLKCICVRA